MLISVLVAAILLRLWKRKKTWSEVSDSLWCGFGSSSPWWWCHS